MELSDSLEFTGERFTPECQREIWYEHFQRYALAARWCANARTLDAACGEGYGSALLAGSATSVEGVDISAEAIAHAGARYGQLEGLNFQTADCISLPFDDDEFDRVVSFETLEHLTGQDQLLAEFKRVLKADGCLILSSPDKAVYSDQHDTSNEYHVKELYRHELEELIQRHFPACRLLGQKLMFHSAIWSLDGFDRVTIDQLESQSLTTPAPISHAISHVISQAPMYFIALCAADDSYLPDSRGQLWLFDDKEESVYQHYHGEIKRNMKAGGLLASLEKQVAELKSKTAPDTASDTPWWRRWFGPR